VTKSGSTVRHRNKRRLEKNKKNKKEEEEEEAAAVLGQAVVQEKGPVNYAVKRLALMTLDQVTINSILGRPIAQVAATGID